ncbi:MAG: sodium:proton antiporter [Aminipila sp.]
MCSKRNFRILIETLMLILCSSIFVFASAEGGHESLGHELPLWSCIPFFGMLVSIAVFPLVNPHWWEHNMLKVSIFWSLVFLIPFGICYGMGMLTYQVVEIVVLDYLPFIVLLFGLFVSAGGIVLKGTLIGTTKTNVILLLIGTLLASWVGTTGAAMLMIRPIIRANAWRERKAHIVVFFIFMVANIGGCLTPVGDPPLFLGFLRGVPFFWTMKLLPLMIINILILTIIFITIDKTLYKKELALGRSPKKLQGNSAKVPLRIEGAHNFIFILMIVGAVVLNGLLPQFSFFANQTTGQLNGIPVMGVIFPYNSIIQMGIILWAASLSIKTTKKAIRQANSFTYAPIEEVAKLFIGIFLTMIPALAILKANGGSLGLNTPAQFFWITGILSSFLDNAPTYLVFLTTAGAMGVTEGIVTTIGTVGFKTLMAISAGAVFMGANTYIGNAPNFMVKSIAEENKIKMPSFFGYICWSVTILIPIFILDTVLFFI